MPSKTILIVSIVLISLAGLAMAYTSQPFKLRSLEIIGKNGGPNGFDDYDLKYTEIVNKATIKLSLVDSGYSKPELPKALIENTEIQPILALFSQYIAASQPTDTAFTFLDYGISMKVKDSGNFHLKVE